jgi:hypothetical protein
LKHNKKKVYLYISLDFPCELVVHLLKPQEGTWIYNTCTLGCLGDITQKDTPSVSHSIERRDPPSQQGSFDGFLGTSETAFGKCHHRAVSDIHIYTSRLPQCSILAISNPGIMVGY